EAGQLAGALDDGLVARLRAVGDVAELLEVDERHLAAQEVLEEVDPEVKAGERHAAGLPRELLQEGCARLAAAGGDRGERSARGLVLPRDGEQRSDHALAVRSQLFVDARADDV